MHMLQIRSITKISVTTMDFVCGIVTQMWLAPCASFHGATNKSLADLLCFLLQQGYGQAGNKIHYSGPLLRPSGNVDQMLKDHDRQIQEVFRRSRMDKYRGRRAQGEPNHAGIKPLDLGVVPIYPSSRGSAPVFTSTRVSRQ